MRTSLFMLYSLLVASVGLCAPMASLDADVFLQNGKDAQSLNAEFASLNASQSCNDGEVACIGKSLAHCTGSAWKTEACPKSLACFALPSVREEGTVVSCTSNATALAVINASGATGGIAANNTDSPVDFPTECDDDNDGGDSQSSSTSVSITGSGTRIHTSASHTASTSKETSITSGLEATSGSVVTVTITVAPSAISTQPAETATLNPSEASSFLSSIATDTNFSIVTTIRHSGSTTAAASATASAGATSAVESTTSDEAQNSTLSSKPVGIASAPSTSAFTSDVGAPTTIILGRPSSRTASASAQATSPVAAAEGDGYSY
ncbi:hypothetical protein C8Q79DRAFT_926496 [Trametes meyenii]|nr:hypothetical protein C8Q79DRAFT_926496 [Trametes meyenii]